ncbi:MAG TPA: M20/M25/M40 family metallo-hydrolase [Anaerohalosphaeraceae bacterium]|nr:M20/M25/M40 family metallo-hydrolase [Phycisphaerae bacterium]HOK94585.1 M20/M25/M40 family metallo-hydrolase [Anaerohalosphaeraceae bacterium]HOL30887.1 M20/M25/M40 family metallo-hydrolase [Anaerohalosphaeraceae bacterium]HOM75555.1 M20/M25/M40 family metallo-hydrolase [Anaerohalosphaeraceae bacterium]HPC64337.1 M20/M25/M40 family metallo-hydrolase [Anaerohalosphaeraceae bacterium]
MNPAVLEIVRRLLHQPTAPYREAAVRRYIADFCKARSIQIHQDRVGNLTAVYGTSYPDSKLAFAAHMDHPGFIIETDAHRRRTTALFYGGLKDAYFRSAGICIFCQSQIVKARIIKMQSDKRFRRRRIWLQVSGDVRQGAVGMWDLPACRIRGSRLYSRACDDLIGCASILALLDLLAQRRIRKKVTALFTVAEEAGLHGAKHLCCSGRLHSGLRIISVETSAALPAAKMEDGVIVRVGDRASLFSPGLTAFLLEAARRIQSKDNTFKYQRKLMDAGTCEATVYSRFGYAAAGICIPLANYHNCNARTGRIAPECVSLGDLENMVKLFAGVVKYCRKADEFLNAAPPAYQQSSGKLGEFFYT